MSKASAAELIEIHREELLRFLFSKTQCRETARDIVQDCFTRLVAYMEENVVHNPRAFLFQVASNQATDYLRRCSRIQNRESEISALPELQDPAPGPEAGADAMMRLDRLVNALEELPPIRREVFILRNIQQYSYAEITQRTGLSYNTIFKYINEALLHCQKKINP